jgi:hypothetical protein
VLAVELRRERPLAGGRVSDVPARHDQRPRARRRIRRVLSGRPIRRWTGPAIALHARHSGRSKTPRECRWSPDQVAVGDELIAVHHRHQDVGNHQIGTLGTDRGEGLAAIRGLMSRCP